MAEGPLFSLRLTDHDFFMAAPELSSSGECRKPRNKNTHYLSRLQVHLLACMQFKSTAAGNPWADSESSHHPAWPMHMHYCCPCKESRISLALSIAALPLKTTTAFCQSCGFQHKILLQPRFPSCPGKQSSRCSVPDGYLCACLCAQLGASVPLSDPSSVQVCAHSSLAGDRCYFIQETLGLQ